MGRVSLSEAAATTAAVLVKRMTLHVEGDDGAGCDRLVPKCVWQSNKPAIVTVLEEFGFVFPGFILFINVYVSYIVRA